MRAPRALAASSTASAAVSFSRSRIGLTSTISSEPSRPGLGDELHRQVRLAVGEAAAHRRADAGRHVGVDDVHVERDVDERRRRATRSRPRGRPPRCRAGRSRSSCRRRRRARGRARARPSSSERTPIERRRARDRAPGSGQASLAKRVPARPSAAASGMPWTLPLGVVSGVFRSPCASNQSTPPGPWTRGQPAERAERDRVVAAEHERRPALADAPRATRAAIRSQVCLDLGQEAGAAGRRSRSPRRRPSSTLPQSAQSMPELARAASSRPA